MNIQLLQEKVRKIEWLLFISIAFLNLLPALWYPYFPTMDSPAHLYNSNLLVELLSNTDSSIHELFIFNPDIVPNWTGHIIMGLIT